VGRALRRQDELIVPSLFGVEVAGALSRRGEPEDKIRDYIARLTSAPHEVIPLGVARARRATDVALAGRLRSADAVYVWLASSRNLPLCTLDEEMAERAAAFCKVVSP
jgi:predicted nucleic acid-binding protein